jgi:hypothetical protein
MPTLHAHLASSFQYLIYLFTAGVGQNSSMVFLGAGIAVLMLAIVFLTT